MADDQLGALTHKVDDIAHRLDRIDQQFTTINQQFRTIDQQFRTIDQHFRTIDQQFRTVDEHFVEQRQYTEFVYDRLRAEMVAGFQGFQKVDRRLDRIESKLDRFIDTQGGINQNHETRITALERRRARRRT